MKQEAHPFDAAKLKEPVRATAANVGRHFRNSAELQDVKELLTLPPLRRNSVTPGLVGSRTQGRFMYSAEELGEKLVRDYGLGSTMDPDEWAMMRVTGVPEEIKNKVRLLAQWLQDAASRTENLNDIDLAGLPVVLHGLVTVDRLSLAQSLIPDRSRSRFDGRDSERVVPVPAAFFPDIDIAVLNGGEEYLAFPFLGRIGTASGTRIHVEEIMPAEVEEGSDAFHLIKRRMLDQFRPLRE